MTTSTGVLKTKDAARILGVSTKRAIALGNEGNFSLVRRGRRGISSTWDAAEVVAFAKAREEMKLGIKRGPIEDSAAVLDAHIAQFEDPTDATDATDAGTLAGAYAGAPIELPVVDPDQIRASVEASAQKLRAALERIALGSQKRAHDAAQENAKEPRGELELELDAIRAIMLMLEPLSPPAITRVIGYVEDRLHRR